MMPLLLNRLPPDDQFWQALSEKYPHVSRVQQEPRMRSWLALYSTGKRQRQMTRLFIARWYGRETVPKQRRQAPTRPQPGLVSSTPEDAEWRRRYRERYLSGR
jgi:hypothetical protein